MIDGNAFRVHNTFFHLEVNPDGHQSFDSLLERDKDSDVLTSKSL